MSALVFPLKVNEGKSRYQRGPYFYLVDGEGQLLAGTGDEDKVVLWRELVDVTERLANGEVPLLHEVTKVVGVTVQQPKVTVYVCDLCDWQNDRMEIHKDPEDGVDCYGTMKQRAVPRCRGCQNNNPVAPSSKLCADCGLRQEMGQAGSMLESTIRRDALG